MPIFNMVISDTASMYEIIGDWHEGHGWPRLPLDLLPTTVAVGFMDDKACSAVWAYNCGEGIAWMDYMVTNPDAGLRGAASLIKLCKEYSDKLVSSGCKYVHSCCRQPSLGRVLEKGGFTKTDEDVVHFIKIDGNR